MRRQKLTTVALSLLQRYKSSGATMKVKELIKDPPKGPLDGYRKRASFDWKSMKLNLYGEESLRFQEELFEFMENSPIFKKPTGHMTMDEHRRRCMAQARELAKNDFRIPLDRNAFNVMFAYDGALPIITGLSFGMVPGIVMSLGTERHSEFMQKFMSGEYRGCFAMTEMSHGSNVKGIRTTATYDTKKKCFILNTPDFEAAKCWVGCLGKCATHAVVFAKLITPDGVNHGVNVFIVQVRDPETLLSMKGVTVGDLGEKNGLNGIDNGFVMFHNYPVPRVNLLDKLSDVTEDGKFVSAIKDANKRFGTSLGTLSMGRVNISSISAEYLATGVTIALRYCCVRQQFGPTDSEELQVIEYQATNTRLVPLVALTYAVKIFSRNFAKNAQSLQAKFFGDGDRNKLAIEGAEIHALSCATKPLVSWLVRDALVDCREACGGHGYLKLARLGDLKNDHDANCTYEGENNVLLQQSCNWLTGQWPKIMNQYAESTTLHSADFLMNFDSIIHRKFTAKTVSEAMKPAKLHEAFEWLVCHHYRRTQERLKQLRSQGQDDFESRNNSQQFFARTLSLVYGEQTLFKNFLDELGNSKWRSEEKAALTKLCSLFGAGLLEKRVGDFYSGGYATQESHFSEFLQQGIIDLSRDLVGEVMALVDVIAPPDIIVQSPLGMADGKLRFRYTNIWKLRYAETEKIWNVPHGGEN
ncbi:peroxisomal acyl-coenzyme A oxidase 3-like isoform X2 [Venturia canescens]|uniref:peroxisomal acyl-coenzyme A oxidase 3-like isoform X2 n=1 Tax=Venturia canescens TaxID=32260 RepID=UPI001C9C22AB|nr:peroxisomal acyl-coenzyme A oxidase 3-like isoform X2 [Venturia canescens]